MHGLHGDFGTMPLKDLIVYLGEQAASGTLRLDRDDVRKSLTLKAGKVVNASSNVVREYLGQFLINLGYITEEQFNSAYETQLQTRIFMGRILVMIGLVNEEVVETVLSTKFRETLLDAYTWQQGFFHFETAAPPMAQDGITVEVPLLLVHRESTFREQAWDQFRRAFPSKTCTVELVRENLAEPPRPGSLDEKLIVGIEAGQTLEELMLATHASDFFFFQRLYSMHKLGAVVVRPPKAPPVTEEIGPPLSSSSSRGRSVQDLVLAANTSLAQGHYRSAFASAAAAAAAAPNDGHKELVRHKGEYLERVMQPQALLAPEEIKGLPLSAAERYLLSRIDGNRTVAAIVRIAPLREFESLAIFERFISAGWVRLS
jgi:hypothetical protein